MLRGGRTGRRWRQAVLLAPVVAALVAASPPAGREPPAGGRLTIITIASSTGRRVPAGFVGLSLELSEVEALAGGDPVRLDPVFVRLIRNLAPAQRPVLRLGGDSTDWTWWPAPGAHRPPGIRYTLHRRWLDVVHALATVLKARLIVGINFEANSRPVASSEARAILQGVGRHWISALELGNEPELYKPLLLAEGNQVRRFGRPWNWDFSRYIADYSRILKGIPRARLAGPSVGSARWRAHLRRFLLAEPRVKLVTLHAYPLKRCSPAAHVSVGQLLSRRSSTGLARRLQPAIEAAHERGLAVRIDEINSVSCGGEAGVSDTFASALWSLDALFSLLRYGSDGVNVHTRLQSSNSLFAVAHRQGQWRISVSPQYLGLMLFAQAAPAKARLLKTAADLPSGLRVWGTTGPDGRTRVVLINEDPVQRRMLELKGTRSNADGTLELLQATGLYARGGVTLGQRTVSPTTGRLSGAPRLISVPPRPGGYLVELPPASAGLLTLSGPGSQVIRSTRGSSSEVAPTAKHDAGP